MIWALAFLLTLQPVFAAASERLFLPSSSKSAVARIKTMEDGSEWLTPEQLDGLLEDFTDFGTDKLLAANQEFLERLYKWQVDKNELTGESNPVVAVIDFDNWENNTFTAINQFRIDTPGTY